MKVLSTFVGLVGAALVALPSFGLTLEGTFTGNTYHVSKAGSNGDAKSWATAKTTIQAAVDLCVDGDTVVVDDGEYAETTNHKITVSSVEYQVPTVVVIQKRIHLVSRNGKEKTHIVGKWSDDGKGAGAGAHRGIYAKANNTLIEGFTIRDCATVGTNAGANDGYNDGGAILGVSSESTRIYLVDSTVDNCRAGQGGAFGYNVVPINCVVSRCRALGTIQVCYRTWYAYNTVFVACGDDSSSHYILPNVQDSWAVNCTFLRNACRTSIPNGKNASNPDKHTMLYNCAFLDNDFSDQSALVHFTNCVSTTTTAADRVYVAAHEAGNPAKCKAGVAKVQCFAPLADDWRLVPGSDLVDAGNSAYLTQAWLPIEYQNKDFYGKPRVVGTSVDAGAVEYQGDEPAPATGSVALGTNIVLSAGSTVVTSKYNKAWMNFSEFPGQVRLTPLLAEGQELFGFMQEGCWDGPYRFPDRDDDGGAWLTPPPNRGEDLTLRVRFAAHSLRVGPGLALATLQDALTASTDFDVIHVAPGTYVGTNGAPECVMITKSVAIRSDAGAEQTIIDGRGVMRCVHVPSSGNNIQVQGFTLTGGWVDDNNVAAGFYSPSCTVSGSVTKLDAIKAQLTDSVVSNNLALYAAGMQGGWAQRCLFTDNRQHSKAAASRQRGAAVRAALVSSSIIRDNPCGVISAMAYGFAYNATFSEFRTSSLTNDTFRPYDMNACAVNCAVFRGYLDNPNANIPRVNVVNEEPYGKIPAYVKPYGAGEVFVDGPGGDLRLQAASPACADGDATCQDAYRFATGDYEGRPIRYVNGNPVPGALQTLVPSLRVVMQRGFPVEPGLSKAVTPGESVTIRVSPDAVHPVVAWVVNGQTNLTSETSLTVSVPADVKSLIVEPVFNADLYVDAEKGDDENNSGASADRPKKTLAAILALALPGDTVHAAPGDYRDGTMTCEDSNAIDAAIGSGAYHPSRAVVSNGVALVATEGSEVTFITGKFDGESEVGNNTGRDTSGRKGPLAVRCVTALAGSTVRGFTIRGGATLNTTGTERIGNVGAGVLAPLPNGGRAATALIENCVISNNWGRTSGGVYGGIIHKCLVVDNNSSSGGTCCQRSLVDQSVLINKSSQSTVKEHYGVRSSTVLVTGSNANNVDLGARDGAAIENCVLLTPNHYSPSVLKNVHNVLWYVGSGSNTFDNATCSGIVTVEAANASKAWTAAGLDSLGRPTSKSAKSVDLGEAAFLGSLVEAATDFLGNPRVSNDGRVDLGAYEYDWRGDYAAALLKKKLTVETADPAVRLVDQTVEIPSGELAATWTAKSGILTVPVEVTGNGTLTVFVGDEPQATVTAKSGKTELKLTATGTPMQIRFVYEPGANDTGVAKVTALSSQVGFMLLVR